MTPLDYGLDEVLALRPLSFHWKDGSGGRNLGFVAQEVDPLVPEVVERGDEQAGLLGMRHSDLVPLLAKAIQEQQQELSRLAARIAELEGGAR